MNTNKNYRNIFKTNNQIVYKIKCENWNFKRSISLWLLIFIETSTIYIACINILQYNTTAYSWCRLSWQGYLRCLQLAQIFLRPLLSTVYNELERPPRVCNFHPWSCGWYLQRPLLSTDYYDWNALPGSVISTAEVADDIYKGSFFPQTTTH